MMHPRVGNWSSGLPGGFSPFDGLKALLQTCVRLLLRVQSTPCTGANVTHHVAPGKMTANEVASMESIDTLNGHPPAISNGGGIVKVNEALVTQAGIH